VTTKLEKQVEYAFLKKNPVFRTWSLLKPSLELSLSIPKVRKIEKIQASDHQTTRLEK
jgi:hypothetical protein